MTSNLQDFAGGRKWRKNAQIFDVLEMTDVSKKMMMIDLLTEFQDAPDIIFYRSSTICTNMLLYYGTFKSIYLM